MSGSTATSSDAAAQRAAEQARLRRERREAKIKAGGSARLNKITGIGGRIAEEPEPAPPVPSASAATDAHAAATDPEEVDISDHFYAPKTTARRVPLAASPIPEPSISDAQLRQMMLGLDRPDQANGGATPVEEDPLMKMMSQMMAGGGGGPGFSSPFPGMPMPQQQAAQPSSSLSLWRILHALVALGLGFFFVLTTHFTGTKVERERAVLAYSEQSEEEAVAQRKRIFFWAFATAEVVLLSTRFFFDKASTQPTGFVATAIGYIPQPYRGYLQIGQRYVQIFAAVRTDILTCMFVLGVCTWCKA